MPAVLRHWNQTIVDEDETLVAFAFALRKQATTGPGSGYGVNRTTAMKSGARASKVNKGKWNSHMFEPRKKSIFCFWEVIGKSILIYQHWINLTLELAS